MPKLGANIIGINLLSKSHKKQRGVNCYTAVLRHWNSCTDQTHCSSRKREAFSSAVFLCDLGPLSFSPAMVNWAPGAGALAKLAFRSRLWRAWGIEIWHWRGAPGDGWWGRTGSAVEVTLRTCFNTKGTWLVSTLTSKLHGNRHSSFFLFSLSTSS